MSHLSVNLQFDTEEFSEVPVVFGVLEALLAFLPCFIRDDCLSEDHIIYQNCIKQEV
jgi:hypothetical protein